MFWIFRDHILLAWAFLIAVTLVSSAIGGVGGWGVTVGKGTATTLVLAIAFVKARVVMFSFMDVRGAPLLLRVLCTIWLILVLGILLAIYAGVFYSI